MRLSDAIVALSQGKFIYREKDDKGFIFIEDNKLLRIWPDGHLSFYDFDYMGLDDNWKIVEKEAVKSLLNSTIKDIQFFIENL